MDSHNTNERWLTVYKYYLLAAVALSVIGLAKFVVFTSDQISGSSLGSASVWNVTQSGLFVFAFWSIRRVGEDWVRTLHLWINGIASITVVIKLFATFSNDFSLYAYTALGNIFVLPIESLVPWQLAHELHLGFLLRWATLIASLMFAAYFFFRWLRSARPTPVQSHAWRKHRVWAGVLTALLGLFLGLFGLAFGQQMAFLSGVMSGVASSRISIPFPVVAIVLGIIIGGLMFCGEQGRGRPMIWLAAVTAPLLTISLSFNPVFILIVLAVSIYLIWVLRKTKPAKVSE